MMRIKILVAGVAILATTVLGTASAHADPTLDRILKSAKPKTTQVHKKEPKREEPKIETPKPIEYVVVSGDTLESLSEAHTTTWQRVWAKNPGMAHPDVLNVGDRLIIPQNDEVLPERPLPTPTVIVAPTVQAVIKPAPVAVSAGCGDNEYAQFIYQKESGCNLNAINAGGCRGIGQACPGSKLPCGADYACQNSFFTNYAVGRYGSWQGAYNSWVSQGWW